MQGDFLHIPHKGEATWYPVVVEQPPSCRDNTEVLFLIDGTTTTTQYYPVPKIDGTQPASLKYMRCELGIVVCATVVDERHQTTNLYDNVDLWSAEIPWQFCEDQHNTPVGTYPAPHFPTFHSIFCSDHIKVFVYHTPPDIKTNHDFHSPISTYAVYFPPQWSIRSYALAVRCPWHYVSSCSSTTPSVGEVCLA